MRTLTIAAAMLGLGACAQTIAESRVRSALVDAGLSEGNAHCMAERMVDRLTINQLRKLEALKGVRRTVPDFLAAVGRVGDSEVVAVTASSAALCTSGLAR